MIIKKRALPSERSALSPYILIGLTNIQNHLYLMIVYFSNYVHSGMQFMPYHHHIEAEKLR